MRNINFREYYISMQHPAPRCEKLPARGSDTGSFSNPQFVALIDAITLKRQDALTHLYARSVAHVHAIAYRFLRSKQDAEEIVCDVFMYVWEHAQEYVCERGSVMGWLAVITRNRAIGRFRSRRRHQSSNDEPLYQATPSLIANVRRPDEVLTQLENSTTVHSALASLSPLRCRLIDMSFFQDLTYEEIAKAMAMPQGTVKSHVRRGLIAMRTALTENSECLATGASTEIVSVRKAHP